MAKRLTVTNYSSTITTGGAAQTAIAANAKRTFLLVQNPPTNTENISVDFGAVAVGDGTDLTLEPGAVVIFDSAVPHEYVSVIAATTSTKFIMKEG